MPDPLFTRESWGGKSWATGPETVRDGATGEPNYNRLFSRRLADDS